MLYVNDIPWRVGERLPGVYKLESIQADGDELEYIRKNFQNIPMTKAPVVRWDGEFAQFIYLNLENQITVNYSGR